MRGLGKLQIRIMEACQEDETRGANFNVEALRTRMSEERGRGKDKAFRVSFARAIAGLVKRHHLCWADDNRKQVRRGPVAPKLPGPTPEELRELAEFFLAEMKKPKTEDDRDYLADGRPKAVSPVDELQRIAMYSSDIGARISAIRTLARWLGDSDPHKPGATEAKWNVIRIAPGEPGHVDYQPPGADAA